MDPSSRPLTRLSPELVPIMAVELRCPDCRAKLRLKTAPDAGTEVECPKCGTVFPAPEPEPEDAPEERAAPKEKKTKTKTAPAPGVPRKRKAKKRETSKLALFAVIGTGLVMLLSVSGVLIWFFTRTSKSVEMMYYAPEDAQNAMGMNIGHAQKYPEFYKSVQQLHSGSDYKAAGDAIAKANGDRDMDALADYMVKAWSNNGSAIIFRTKYEFDGDVLKKIPGATAQKSGDKTYYSVPSFTGTGERQRVFSPTDRLVVVCPESTKDATFKKMITGHADSREKTLGMRMGDLGKRVTRGTFWQMTVFDNEVGSPAAPAAPAGGAAGGGGDDSKAQLGRTIAETTSSARGMGIKASLGSREVRFEICVWYKDSEKSSSVAQKWKDSELAKGDEGTPPKWFKDETSGMGDRKVATQLLSNISFGASGDVFYARSSVETVEIQTAAASALGKVTGQRAQGGPPGGGPGGIGPPGGGPGGFGPPGPGGGPPKGPRRRRFLRVASCR